MSEVYHTYDIEEIYTNCTVQILKNSATGEESFGWWKNDEPPKYIMTPKTAGEEEDDGR